MTRSVKIGLSVVGLIALLAAAVTAGVLLWRPSLISGPECTVPGDQASPTTQPSVDLTIVQLQHASTINGIGLARTIPERGRIIAVATAYQESGLRNRSNGDRDSVGLFQQRPSQGWGTAAEIKDPLYATGKFYDALQQVPNWPELTVTQAAQAVQFSAFPDAYAKWEPQATTLVRALSGADLELTCSAGARQPTAETPDRPAPAGTDNATPQLIAALAAAQAELGPLTVRSLTANGQTGTVSLALPGLDDAMSGRVLAAWSLAHSASFGIAQVAVQDRRWVDHAWQTGSSSGDPAAVVITVG